MECSAIGTRDNIKVIDSAENKGMRVEVLEYLKLKGSPSIMGAQQMYFMEKLPGKSDKKVDKLLSILKTIL